MSYSMMYTYGIPGVCFSCFKEWVCVHRKNIMIYFPLNADTTEHASLVWEENNMPPKCS